MKKNNLNVKLHQISSFSKIFTTSVKDSINTIRAFIPGCSLASYSPDIVIKTYEYLKKNLPGTGMILKCCASPSKLAGNKDDFKKYYSQLEDEIEKMNVNEVIIACQSCFKTIKENSKNIKVKSLWEVISTIDIPNHIKNKYKDLDITFALHDPCPTRNESNIHESIRKIVNDMGIKIEEFNNSKEKTLCCGGMLNIKDKSLALNQMKKRANEVNSKYILTYCESCVESMIIGGKNSIHILDLMFNEEIYLKFTQSKVNALKKWKNRYKCKNMIERLNKNSLL
ncbi:(Fe-S)-binding protein [Tepidibacter formicigenes]|jgi:Fe-S oxidoreductase|uniref:Cysteine-rich domain-containing protein n=1 Tax=Tepidibacter formicigenes DSM 15518 TaxID=1123349 RepID=A0A1M6PZT6_9FIRM|nr:(Fe-S)-binding protein [Tepidibacter formicigenes]SHK13376.1 Cysteine-rich domain-containing protein [Tepidibacter formicigenes DSM 15518]